MHLKHGIAKEGSLRSSQTEEVYEDYFLAQEGELFVLEGSWLESAAGLDESPVSSWRYRYLKRAFDFSLALLIMIAIAIPCLLIACAIALTSEGPVFYHEERIGRSGSPFRIWKFRSMRTSRVLPPGVAEVRPRGKVLEWRMHKKDSDPRITAVGGFLRRWSLDELPQIYNILRGDMSLIGPRPIVQSETVLYDKWLPYYLEVVPGLSGLWQVSGRSLIGYEERARLDATYVQSWSLISDVKILCLTIPAVLRRVGAY
jgi:lipopolysaccharide/colanic/teichoic acid biosynthesis glycosyltransferase